MCIEQTFPGLTDMVKKTTTFKGFDQYGSHDDKNKDKNVSFWCHWPVF